MIWLINAPSILGLRPTGVELLPEALARAGLIEKLGITQSTTLTPPAYNSERDAATDMLNPQGIADYSVTLANTVEPLIMQGDFPLLLGGDCSILLGSALALKRQGRYGLFFLDGHADFYQPHASVTGEAADMDLALVSGRGPDIVTNIEQRGPLMRDEDIIQFGQRDRAETVEFDSQQIADTPVHVYELDKIRKDGIEQSCQAALQILLNQPIEGIWLHIDADVLDDTQVPAVDYRQPGGLRFSELRTILETLLASGKVVGLELTDFNPTLDPTGAIAAKLVDLLTVLKRK